jgi:hypothetical protein
MRKTYSNAVFVREIIEILDLVGLGQPVANTTVFGDQRCRSARPQVVGTCLQTGGPGGSSLHQNMCVALRPD